MKSYNFILALACCFTMTACDSPMNNRISPNSKSQDSSFQAMSFAQLNIDVEYKWVSGPVGRIDQKSHLIVFIYIDGVLQSLPKGLTLEFYSSMPSMGHPMDDAGFFEEIEPGIFINKNIRFNMAGDWRHELWVMDVNFNILDRVVWNDFF